VQQKAQREMRVEVFGTCVGQAPVSRGRVVELACVEQQSRQRGECLSVPRMDVENPAIDRFRRREPRCAAMLSRLSQRLLDVQHRRRDASNPLGAMFGCILGECVC